MKKFIFQKSKNRPKNKKAARTGGFCCCAKNLRSSLLWGSGFFCLGCLFLAFDVALPAFPIFDFVGLFAHKCLYFVCVLRFCGVHYESFGPTIQHLFGAGNPAGIVLRLSDPPGEANRRFTRPHRTQLRPRRHQPDHFRAPIRSRAGHHQERTVFDGSQRRRRQGHGRDRRFCHRN